MEHEQFRSLPQDMQDWFQDFKPTPNLALKLSNESKTFFREAHEKFMSSREENTSSFVRFMQHNEDQFSQLLKSSSQATFVEYEQDGHEFTRSSSTGSEWRMRPQVGEKCNEPTEDHTVNTSSLPQNANHILSPENAFFQFRNIPSFPRFNPFMVSASVRNRRICAESWSGAEKISMSRSSIECRTHSSYRYAADKIIQSCYEAYNISESESEDEEMVSNKSLPSSCHYSHEHAASESDVSSLAPSEQSECHALEQQQYPLAIEAPPDSRQEKAYCIAMELLTTERSYVAVLHLIDQIFHFRVDQENRAHNMFPQEVVPQMFSNIKSIYQFHHDFLLPQLEDRMVNWEKHKKIGDIMKNFAPFLKLYTEYVKNFDNAMNVINAVGAKNQRFAAIMEEIHHMSECGNLTLSHHMLGPIQRIPRYELLLKDYLKKLPEDSPDREDTEKALHLVSTAANHANEAMKKIDKFKKLLEVQEKISGAVDLISPTRELLKEGKIVKISARSGDHQERYLFLFSDLLLLCSPRLLPNRVGIGGITGPAYRLRAKFFMESIQVLEGDNLETANTFYIQDDHKTVELYTQTLEEKTAWLDVLCVAIEELYKRKSSFKIGAEVSAHLNNELGKKHPQYIKIESVQKCMDCGAGFGVMRRKHHCRACGLVVCGKCSNQKYPLPCEDDKVSRVCRQCYQTLAQQTSVCSPEKSCASYTTTDSDADAKENTNLSCSRGKGLLEVPANASCVLSGYLQLKCSKTWVRRWFALHPDFVLYSFRSDADERAMTATPLPGYAIDKITEQKNESFSDKDKLFKMYHTKKMYYFQASSKEEAERWVHALQMAAQAELPSPEKFNR